MQKMGDQVAFANNARYYSFDLAAPVAPSTFAITDFDGDGNWELTYTQFDRNGLGATKHPIKILEFRDVAVTENLSWIFEPAGSLVDITAQVFSDDPNGIPEIEFGRQMIVKDVNGDGFDDLLVANHGFDRDPFPGGQNIIAVSDGVGGLIDLSAQFETEAQFTHSMAVGDFDGDGRTDLFFGNLNVDPAYFATFAGSGDTATAILNSFPDVPEANRYTRSFAADIDADGIDELFLGGDAGVPDKIARWSENRWQTAVLPTQAAQITLDFQSGDLNGDGRDDLVILSTGSNYQGIGITVLVQTAAGGFVDASATWVSSSLGVLPNDTWASDINLADLDGDGDLDMTLAVQYPYNDRVLWNEGGRFTISDQPGTSIFGVEAAGSWGHDSDAATLMAKDLDGDGVAEVIAVELGIVTIYHYETPVEIGTEDDDAMDAGAWADAILFGRGGDDVLRGWNGDDLLNGEAGNDTLQGWSGHDQLFGGDGDDVLLAGDGDDVVFGGNGHDVIKANPNGLDATPTTSGANLFVGGAGNDTIVGGEGRDTILGGSGSDEIVWVAGADAIYSDGLDLSTTDNAARIFRIYQAAFDREPDANGYTAWTERLEFGSQSFQQVVKSFVSSVEFQQTYGALNNEDFIRLLYNNVLDRAPDPVGLTNWTNRLEAGTNRETVVIGFSESAEFVANTAAAANSFANQRMETNWNDDVYRLYLATLDREPDAVGFKNWSIRLAAGDSYLSVASGFVNSPEFQNTYGALSHSGFISLLYNTVLGRTADQTGLANWTERLESGSLSRTEVVHGFAQSAEFIAATTDNFASFVRSLGTDDVIELHQTGSVANLDDTSMTTLYGGAYADRFEFQTNATVTIADFEPWDTVAVNQFRYWDGTTISQSDLDTFEFFGIDVDSLSYDELYWQLAQSVEQQDILGLLKQDGNDVLLSLGGLDENIGTPDLRFLNAQVADFTLENFDFL